MRKSKIVFVAIVSSFLVSCKEEVKKDENSPSKTESVVVKECYESIENKDTIKLELVIDKENVSGNLVYNYFEKDKNVGTIEGKMYGDTLFADYKFMSEGEESFQQVAFIRKNGTISEFYGEVEEKEGKIVFKDKSKLILNSEFVLNSVTCK